MPAISVVVPFFNSDRFLTEAVESVRRQTFYDWEIILVNDGSTDHSLDDALRYVSMDGRITLVEHPGGLNKGTSASRNLGARVATGRYLANLDHDDYFESTKLESQYLLLEKDPTLAMTFGPMKFWYSWNKEQGEEDTTQNFTFAVPAIFEPPSFIPKLVSGENDPHGYLLRKDVFDEVGGYEESVSFCEDWSLYFKVMLGYRFHVSNVPLYRYRRHANQLSYMAIIDKSYYGRFQDFFEFAFQYLKTRADGRREILLSLKKYAEKFRKLDEQTARS